MGAGPRARRSIGRAASRRGDRGGARRGRARPRRWGGRRPYQRTSRSGSSVSTRSWRWSSATRWVGGWERRSRRPCAFDHPTPAAIARLSGHEDRPELGPGPAQAPSTTPLAPAATGLDSPSCRSTPLTRPRGRDRDASRWESAGWPTLFASSRTPGGFAQRAADVTWALEAVGAERRRHPGHAHARDRAGGGARARAQPATSIRRVVRLPQAHARAGRHRPLDGRADDLRAGGRARRRRPADAPASWPWSRQRSWRRARRSGRPREPHDASAG